MFVQFFCLYMGGVGRVIFLGGTANYVSYTCLGDTANCFGWLKFSRLNILSQS